MMSTELITEGTTELEVPELARFRTPTGGYAPSLAQVFYNPHAELCRDISVSVAQALTNELGNLRICDPLAGVGARGLRYTREVMGITKVIVNDRLPEAVELIHRNVERNKLSELVEVFNEDANVLLWRYRPRFHVIDLDPFGSPAPFVDAACSALARNGVLMLTATDTAPLCGAYPKACLRRYGVRSLRTEYCHELGVRILVGFCQRVGARHDFALMPLLVHSTEHYLRVYLRARSGAKRADEVLIKQGYVSHCGACGRRVLSFGLTTELPNTCKCGEKLEHAGPMWLGPLMDKGFIQLVISDLASRNFKLGQRALVLLNRCVEEADGPPMFYDVHEIAKRAGLSPPKLDKIIARLREHGRFASRTHFSGTGLRTDASMDELHHALTRSRRESPAL